MRLDSLNGDSSFKQFVRALADQSANDTPYHSLELNDGLVVPGIIPLQNLRARLDSFSLPRDLRGKRVLDIGAASGWCSFEAERRGAEVVAIDCVEFGEFTAAKQLLGSKVEYAILELEELTPERFGLFDYTIFFGVLYDLRHPLLGLERVCAVTRGEALVESYVIRDETGEGRRLLEFYETDELGGQIDNWFGFTPECLLALIRSAGFARADLLYRNDHWRAGVKAHRNWESESVPPSAASPLFLRAVLNNRHLDGVFQPPKDEYMCVYFLAAGELTKEDVHVYVGSFGAPALSLSRIDDAWQANVRVPPGLLPGVHEVRVSVPGFSSSEAVEITVLSAGADRSLAWEPFIEKGDSALAPELVVVANSRDNSKLFRGDRGERLACYFIDRRVEAKVRLADIQVWIDDAPNPALSIGRKDRAIWWVATPIAALTPGEHSVRLRISGTGFSNCQTITLLSRETQLRPGIQAVNEIH